MSWSILFYVLEWGVRLAMLVVIPYRRRPHAAMAWLMIVLVQPFVGLALYLMIGENRLPKRRLAAHTRLLRSFREMQRRLENHPNIEHPDLGPELDSTVRLAANLGRMPILGGNNFEIITNTVKTIDRLVADIDESRSSVHLLFYIYAADATGGRVGEALARAAARGVECRLLADAVGSAPFFKRRAAELMSRGVRVYPALPVNPLRRHMDRIDLRNHRKVAVIDGRIGYTGSLNISDSDYGHEDLDWRDLMLRLTGPIVLELQEVFVQDWYFETAAILDGKEIYPDPPKTGEIAMQTLPSGPNFDTENHQRLIVSALHAARKRVIITTPYFVPDQPLLQAMETAVLRGVEVDLVIPRCCDQRFVGHATRAYYDNVLEAGVRLHLYGKGLLHAKTMTIDDGLALIGSSNFDFRSFELNFEIMLLLFGQSATDEVRTRQRHYIASSDRMTIEEWSRRPRHQRVLQNAAKLLSPLL